MRIALGGVTPQALKARIEMAGVAIRQRLDGWRAAAVPVVHARLLAAGAMLARAGDRIAPVFSGGVSFRDGLADGFASIGALIRAGGRMLWRAGGATKAGLLFATALMLLTVLPKPDPFAMATPELRSAAAVSLEPGVPATAPYARDPWKAVRRSLAAYGLDAPEFGRDAPVYRIRATSVARQDLLVFPPRDNRAFSGAISIEQNGPGGRLSDTIFVESARRAALLGASIERMAQPTGLSTKFGEFEVSDAQILQQSQLRSCLAFRLIAEAPVEIAGLLCGEPSRPADRATLACILDRIDLISAGNDKALKSYFAQAERARGECGRGQTLRSPGLKQVIFDQTRIRG